MPTHASPDPPFAVPPTTSTAAPAGTTALKTKDWTSHIDTDTKGAARSVKKTKKEKKRTAKAALEAPSDFVCQPTDCDM